MGVKPPSGRSRKFAVPIALAVEIHCPNIVGCGREDPIPSSDGSFMWDRLPETVTCPDCRQTFRVKTTMPM